MTRDKNSRRGVHRGAPTTRMAPEANIPSSSRPRGRPRGSSSATTPAMRDAILRKAREAFGEMGYDATALELIAARTGVSRPSVNYHFGDKRALYREVVRSTTAAVMSTAAERASAAPNLIAQLSLFIDISLVIDAVTAAHAEDEPAAGFLFTSMMESQRHPGLNESGDDPLATTRDFLTLAVKSACRARRAGRGRSHFGGCRDAARARLGDRLLRRLCGTR